MSKEEDFGDEGARPSSLVPVHRPAIRDPLHDLQLLRDVAIINEQVRRELGPPAAMSGGVSGKWKESKEEDTVELRKLAALAAVSSVGAVSAYGASQRDESLTIPPAIREFVGGDRALLAYKSATDSNGGRTTAIIMRHPRDPDPGLSADDEIPYTCELVLFRGEGEDIRVTGRTRKVVNCDSNDFNRRAGELDLNARLELSPRKVSYRNDYHRVGSYSYSFEFADGSWHLSSAKSIYPLPEEDSDGVKVVKEEIAYPTTIGLIPIAKFDPGDIEETLSKNQSLVP